MYGAFDVESVVFGESVTLTCDMTESTTLTRRAECVYEDGNVRLGGDDVTFCPGTHNIDILLSLLSTVEYAMA